MIKFKKGTLQVKLLDTTIVVSNNKRNVFNLLYAEDTETLKAIEKDLKTCKNNFKFKMSYNARKDILKVMVNNVIYSLNAILI